MNVGDLVSSKSNWDYHGIVIDIGNEKPAGVPVTVLWKDGQCGTHSKCYLKVINEGR